MTDRDKTMYAYLGLGLLAWLWTGGLGFALFTLIPLTILLRDWWRS